MKFPWHLTIRIILRKFEINLSIYVRKSSKIFHKGLKFLDEMRN